MPQPSDKAGLCGFRAALLWLCAGCAAVPDSTAYLRPESGGWTASPRGTAFVWVDRRFVARCDRAAMSVTNRWSEPLRVAFRRAGGGEGGAVLGDGIVRRDVGPFGEDRTAIEIVDGAVTVVPVGGSVEMRVRDADGALWDRGIDWSIALESDGVVDVVPAKFVPDWHSFLRPVMLVPHH